MIVLLCEVARVAGVSGFKWETVTSFGDFSARIIHLLSVEASGVGRAGFDVCVVEMDGPGYVACLFSCLKGALAVVQAAPSVRRSKRLQELLSTVLVFQSTIPFVAVTSVWSSSHRDGYVTRRAAFVPCPVDLLCGTSQAVGTRVQ